MMNKVEYIWYEACTSRQHSVGSKAGADQWSALSGIKLSVYRAHLIAGSKRRARLLKKRWNATINLHNECRHAALLSV